MTYPNQAPMPVATTSWVPVQTNHILHLILTLVTLGFWSPVWFIVALYNHNRTRQVTTWSYPVAPQYPNTQNQGQPNG